MSVCPHCGSPTRRHCKGEKCDLQTCTNPNCLTFGNEKRWTTPKPPEPRGLYST